MTAQDKPANLKSIPDVNAMVNRLTDMAAKMRQTADNIDMMARELLQFKDIEAALAQVQAFTQTMAAMGLLAPQTPSAKEPETPADDDRDRSASDDKPPSTPAPEPTPEPTPEPNPNPEPAPKPAPPAVKPDERPDHVTRTRTEPDKSPVTQTRPQEPEHKPSETSSPNQILESMLPDDMRNPSFGRRLAVIRGQYELTRTELAELANIDERDLRQLETNAAIPTDRQLDTLAAALDIPRTTLVSAPMSVVAPLAGTKTLGERIRLLRIRAGLTQAQLSTRLRVSVDTVQAYESDARVPSDISHVSVALNVPRTGLTTYLETQPITQPSSRDAYANHLSTGQKVMALRIARGWTHNDLARKTGISASHLAQIESGGHNPARTRFRPWPRPSTSRHWTSSASRRTT